MAERLLRAPATRVISNHGEALVTMWARDARMVRTLPDSFTIDTLAVDPAVAMAIIAAGAVIPADPPLIPGEPAQSYSLNPSLVVV